MIHIFVAWCLLSAAQGAVLDPALYLAPSPPLTPSSDSLSPGERWLEPLEIRIEREAKLNVVPLDKLDNSEQAELETTDPPERKEEPQPIEKSGSQWPGRANYGLGSINIPLTFSLSGTYGRYGGDGGLVGSSYASAFNGFSGMYGGYGKSGLAGSSYGSGPASQGIRIFGSGGGPAWSGWGNGKWGHYGKG